MKSSNISAAQCNYLYKKHIQMKGCIICVALKNADKSFFVTQTTYLSLFLKYLYISNGLKLYSNKNFALNEITYRVVSTLYIIRRINE